MSVINTNVKSLIAQDSLRANNNKLSQAMERLSTGSKVNSAKDDAAGLAIGTRMTSQVRGLNMAIKNANDGINLAQTAEGAMTEVTDMLQRMRELAVQAGNSTNTDSDRAAMNDELTQLKSEIDRVAKTTQFNNMNILDGSFSGKLQIGNNATQTMDLAIGAVDTKTLGATTHGAALSATTAKLQVSGAAQNVAAYQGASFGVTVNGVTKTVTLPPASSQTANVAGANAAVSFAAPDAVPSNSASGQVGAAYEIFKDLSTASNAILEVKLNTGATQNIDISASSYYADKTHATGTEIVKALQTELDKNSAFQGANAMKVSLDNGHLTIGLASGAKGTIAISNAAGSHALLNTIMGATTTLTTNSGSIQMGATALSVSTKTGFDVGSNHFDLTAAISAHGFNQAALTGEQFVQVYNETAKVNGVNVSTASLDSKGYLTFSGANPTTPAVGSPFANNGDLTTALHITASTNYDPTSFLDTTTAKFGEYATTITPTTNDVLTLGVNGGQAVSLTIPAKTGGYATMSELASAIQTQVDQNGALTGANAVTVTAVQDDKNRWGLSFSNASGHNIEVSGTFVTGTTKTQNTGFQAAVGGASVTLEASTSIAGSVTDDSVAHKITVHGPSFPASVGNKAIAERTVDFSAANDKKFSVAIYGGAKVDLDLSTAFTKTGVDTAAKLAKVTGGQLVDALNYALQNDGHFAGDNAITASLSSAGQIQLQIAKVNPPAGGSTSPIIEIADATAVGNITGAAGSNFLTALTGVNNTAAAAALVSDGTGRLSMVNAPSDAERFGSTDLVVTANTNDGLQITVGKNGLPVNLKLDAGVYSDADALINNINKQINASGAFKGANALTVSAVKDSNGDTGFTISSATGQQVKVGGLLISAAAATTAGNSTGGFGVTSENGTVTFPPPAATVGGVDLSKGDDVTLAVADSAGNLVTKSFNLGNDGAHVSRSDYAATLQSAANQAFEGTGISFTASVTDGKLSFASNQVSSSSFTMTGQGAVAAFGQEVNGSATTQTVAGNKFSSMSDVAVEINKDLEGVATAAYDNATKTWSFTASGDAGTNSSISLSGAGLSTVQFGGTLSAAGGAGDATASKLADVNVLTTAASTAALGSIDNSIEYVSKQRSLLGAIQNRLEHTVNNLTNIVTNTEASRSAILDADYSKETTALAKSQILTQAATAMLAQANQSAQGVLSLLK